MLFTHLTIQLENRLVWLWEWEWHFTVLQVLEHILKLEDSTNTSLDQETLKRGTQFKKLVVNVSTHNFATSSST
ncbi:hypothetical protein AMECASPLE_014382 [Ameca splendens]|uniref:Uncharacterized protein n=1 Tax=Ameca splendens TaxID=208324 RepID=A0ABV0XEU0_9TELE